MPEQPEGSGSSATDAPNDPSAVVVLDDVEDAPARAGVVAWARARGPVARGGAAFVLYLLTSILVFALPVIGHLHSRCVGACVSDAKLYVWSFEWMRFAVAHGLDPLYSTYVWAPSGTNLAWVTTLPGPAFVMIPVTALFGPLVTENVLMILAPALAGWATYLVCNQITRRFLPSLAGGFVFGFSTYISQHMRAHVNLLLIFFVPLAVYLVLRRVQGTLRVWTFVLLLAGVLFGQFATSSELFATMTLFGGIAFFLALAFGGSLRPRIFRTMLWTGLAYVVAGLAMLPILLQAFQDVPPDEVRPTTKNAIDLLGYLVPSRSARFGGAAWTSVSNGFPGLAQDNTAYMSFALLAVVVLFAIWGWRSKSTWLLISALAIPMVLSFGPVLYVGGDPTIWMPQALLGKVPLLQHALPERFPAYAWLALAVIVAVWLAGLGRSVAIFGYALVAFGLVLVSTDLSDAPGYHGEMSVPAFFTDGTYRDFIEPGETVLAVPPALGEDGVWQAETGMAFRLARAYTGPIHLSNDPLPEIGGVLAGGDGPVPTVGTLARFLEARDVTKVITIMPAPKGVEDLLRSTLGTEPNVVDGVAVWDVPDVLPVTGA